MYIQELYTRQNDVMNCIEEWRNSKTNLHLRTALPVFSQLPTYSTFHYTPGGTFLFMSINVHQ